MKELYLLGVVSVLLAVSPAQATPLISNLPCCGQITNLTAAIANNLAAGFALPAGTDYSLTSVTLNMSVFTGGSVILTLHGGSASAPSGAALAAFDNPNFPSGAATPYTFTPSSPFTLLANTNYWLVLQGDGNTQNTVNWNSAQPGLTPTGIATFLGQTSDSGFPPTTATTSANRFAFQVDGEVVTSDVPEPGTYTLLATGLAAMCWRRRRSFTAPYRR